MSIFWVVVGGIVLGLMDWAWSVMPWRVPLLVAGTACVIVAVLLRRRAALRWGVVALGLAIWLYVGLAVVIHAESLRRAALPPMQVPEGE